MERFWTKEVRRRMAAIVCAALMITAVFQYFSPVNAQEQEGNVFYLDRITVTADEGSVSDNAIVIRDGENEFAFEIDQNGKLVNSNNVQGVSVSGSDGLVWTGVASDKLDIVYKGSDVYFASDQVSISGNDQQTEINITLYKKHTLNTKIYIQTAESGENNLSSVDGMEVTYTNLDDQSVSSGNAGKPIDAKKNNGGYQAKVTLGGIETTVNADLDNDNNITYRGYIEYGTDFILKDRDGNDISEMNPDKCYYVSEIVIKGKAKSKDNPFSTYTLKIDGNTICEGNILENDQTISISNLQIGSGNAEITFNFADYKLPDTCNNSIAFKIDNEKPVIKTQEYKLGSESAKFQNLVAGSRLIDSTSISLRFTVEEANGLQEAYIVYYANGEKADPVKIDVPDPEEGEYTFTWEGFKPDVSYTNLGFQVIDLAGNTAEWGSVENYILDHTAPVVYEVLWSSDGGTTKAEIEDQKSLLAQNIGVTFVVKEENGISCDNDHIKLSYKYKKDGSQEEVSEEVSLDSITIEDKRNSSEEGDYWFTFNLPDKDAVYTDFILHLEDEVGNHGDDYTSDWTATTDNTAPKIKEESIWWEISDGDKFEINDNKINASSGIKLCIPIEETNGIDKEAISLQYKADGSSPNNIEWTLTEDDILSFVLPVNATYTDFSLTVWDKAGNESTYEPGWKIVLDNKEPGVTGTWIRDSANESAEIGEDECLIAKQSIQLNLSVQKRLDIKTETVVLHYEKDGETELQTLSAAESNENGKDYGDRTYLFTFVLPQEDANCDSFYLTFEDVTGKIHTINFGWSAIIDGTDPAIESVTWSSEKVNGEPVATPADILVDSQKVKLTLNIIEKNIDSVTLYSMENDNRTFIAKGIKDGDQGFIFEIDTAKYNYKALFFEVIDKAGNKCAYGYEDGNSLKVIIDREEPKMTELTYEYPEKDIWYRDQNVPVQYSFTLKDYSDIESIKMVAENGTIWDLTEGCKRIGDRDADGRYTYQIMTTDERFADARDQELNYYFVIKDQWGNELSTTGSNNVVKMKVDNTAPSNVAYVAFSGDKDKLNYTNGDLTEKKKHYQYGNASVSGTIYNQNTVQLKIYVADLPGANAINQAASGIAEVKVNYRYTEESVTLSKAEYEQKDTLTYGGENNENVIRTPATVTINNQELSMDELDFNLDITNGQRQKITSIDSIELWDAAGNYTKITEFASADDLTVDYVLDNTAPELSHEIPGSSGYGKDANTYYYNTNAVDMYVTIAENNFFPDDVKTNLKAGEATKTVTMSAFQNIGSYNYRSHFTMGEGDGVYRFTLGYQDRSENVMVFQGGGEAYVADGTYTSPILVLDTTAPVLNIRYYRGGQDITDSITGGMCFSGDVSAVISITEVNFDPELVQIAFSATDAGNNQAFGITYNPSAWNRNGDTWSYTIPCTTEGHYSLTASCTDKAGNHSNGVPTSNFTIDKTAPAVAITYDTTVENGYYNTNRTATVTVTDQNFNEQAIEYVITSTGMQPALTGWSHGAGSGCDGTNHVKSCRWSCQAVFSEDADYTFTFNCVDKAGNASAPVEEQAFTIDQTLPVIQVGYDNNDSLNGYYFKEGRTATVTITEHNFNSSDVNLVISSPDGEVHNPTAWRNSTADVYVCEIPYDADGDYSFDISYTDLAGNAAEAYAGDQFVIDLTAPELEISGVEDKSANNGVVAPVVSFSDKNYDAEEVTVTITGVNNGRTALEYAVTTNADGQTLEFMDFSHTQEMDDLYTLEAVITDKAGNSTEGSILFSVNRFGSVYIFSEDTQAVLDRFYTNQGPELTITEINVDTLEHQEISYSCDGNVVVLNQGTDYTVQESGSEYEWKQYTYEIAGSNFDAEGVYAVTIQSVDRAANDMTNRLKEKSIEFTVDKTAPSVVLGGIENGGSYAETSRVLTIDAVDNIYLESVEIYLNEELAASFDEDTLAEYHGQVSYEVQEAGSVQTLYILARDAAGNEMQTDLIRFLISSNVLIRWFYNRPLFFGSIVGVLAVAGGCFFLVFKRRKKKETVESNV